MSPQRIHFMMPSLAEDVAEALRTSGYADLRTIDVTVEGPSVVLQGQVPTYHMKQMAQVVAIAVIGVRDLCNNVEVIGAS